MRDITTALIESASRKSEWSEASTLEALKLLAAAIEGSETDWEPEEAWARILVGGKREVAYLSALVPLMIVDAGFQDNILSIAERLHLICIPVDAMDERLFKVDKPALENIVGREVSENVDYDQLSAQELWWATV